VPKPVATTHVLAEGKLVVYRRAGSEVWQCRYKAGSAWQRESTKEHDLTKAKDKAWDLMREADFRVRNNLPAISRRFKDVAALAVKRMQTDLDNRHGKIISTRTTLRRQTII
jgi:hypothetical protein